MDRELTWMDGSMAKHELTWMDGSMAKHEAIIRAFAVTDDGKKGVYQPKILQRPNQNKFEVYAKKVVVKLELHDTKVWRKAMKTIANLSGVESVAIDREDKKMTVTGNGGLDPINVLSKLRKFCRTEIIAVGPANEPEKEGEKKEIADSSTSSLFSSSPSSPSSFSSSSDSQVTHDLFINFSPKDDSKIFVSRLNVALAKAGIEPYTNYQLHKGTELGLEELLLEGAHIFILVFSQNYTESSSCLNELQQIMKCRRTHGHMVMPVFYNVDPSVVRHQRGAFGKQLHTTAEGRYLDRELRKNMLLAWKSALTQAASLVGWDATNYRNEADLMQQIVGDVLGKLKSGISGGMELQVRIMTELIVNQSSKVSSIGIWGMGGVGKTTTAKAIYDRLQGKFFNASFIENVRKVCEWENSGIIHLQQQLLSDILKTNVMIRSIAEGEMMITERLKGKKVLVVLDDVTTFEQVEALFGNPKLFGPGSVLIVTTRDARLLCLFKADYVCTMKEMDENESLELFSWYAFRQPSPIKDFNELSRNAIAYCTGLPLVLEVLGSYLFAKTKQEWLCELSKLERIPNDQVHEKLKLSYDDLQDMVKDIFLDICCFFIGKDRDYVTDILNGCGLYADVGIAVLIERSLVKIGKNNKLEMHDLIRDMGREIVRKSSTEEPGKRSRLWFHDDVDDVLTKYSGTETVKGLVLKSRGTGRVSFSTNSFKEMNKLRLLQLDRVDLTGDYGNLSKELKWVHWQGFACNFIPDDFHQGNLVVFELKHSNIKQVWNETKVLVNLKILNLSHSRYLKNTPDFSKLPYLEKLIMKDCPCLSEIHPSIGDLNSLLLINLKDCIGLNNLPKKIYQLKSLKTLILSGCLKIDKLEEDIKQMESLTTLIAKNTAIKEVPFSIVLVNLKILNLSHSRYLKSSPDFSKLPNLEKLIMKDCPCLFEIHPSIGDLNNLHLINLKDCTGLSNLSEKIFQLKSLITLDLSGCLKIDEKHADDKHVSKNDVDAKSKGGPSRCDYQRDVDEASIHVEILNQSEDADEKGALVNNVDVNRRMIEQIPYAVAESLFNRLASTTFREHGRIYGVMDELERLKNNVESIRAVLPDAQKKQEQDCVVQNWITSLKDALHLADDLLDEFIIQGMRYKEDASDKNQVTWVHSSSSSHNFLHQKVAPEIEKIQKKFDDVLEEMDKLKLSPKDVVVKQTDSLRSKSISFLLKSDITGREVDKEEIINLLRQPHGNISSIAIGGIGGIGKTTLAQFVYNDVEVQNHFEKRMWVCVSNHFDVKTIVTKMLESLIDGKIDAKLSFEYIQHKLRENLTGERYLLVLDDICNGSHENWTQLRTYLMCGAKDSKVLMTTRCKNLSEIPKASNLLVLNGLTLDVSWSMLKKITFWKYTSVGNKKFRSIGKKIANKCRGVPLAIRALGGLLQSKSEEREWINVLQGDFWKLCEDKESIMPILNLSYKSLSLRLRQCFAYCSLYPKDWEIKKDLLIQLWMAQGYLDCADEKTLMEDVGNEFVKIFLMKSFFQDAKVGEDGDIVSFKMHDLMHDLATQVAGNDCCYLDRETKIWVQRPVHVSLEPSAVHMLDSLDASRLRTLILLSSNEEEELNEDELLVISKFKHLRVLKLSHCSLSKLSTSIGKLKHLRYLNLSHCRGLRSLYKSISSLVLLQTLILTPEDKFEFSTEVVSKLINLRHLHISNWEASKDEMPSEFAKLRIWKYEGMVFSKWLSPLTNIVEISFFLCGSLQYLPPLERLPFLKSLHISFLEELEYMCYEQDFTSAFFPSLESLSLQFCYKFRGWWRMGDDFNDSNCSQKLSLPPFPRLSQLSIIGCRVLTCMPAFPNLENRLELYNSCVETLVGTLNTVALESLNRFPPLSMLKSLHIDGVTLDVKRIPKDWMQNLTSLQLLQINWFSCQAIEEIETWFKDDHKCLPSLQTIAFHSCEDLEALPDWICNLSSLQHLRVYDCINLASLPEGMPRLTNLQTLQIIGCPLLDEECQTQTDETWPKIRHVPNIILSSLH